MTDSEILALFQARDERAIAGCREKYGDYCMAVAKNVLGDGRDAEECVNDTWIRAWEAIPPAEPASLKLFLARITRNGAYDVYRRENRRKREGDNFAAALEEIEEFLPGGDDPQVRLEEKELTDRINRGLLLLPTRDRNLFIRRYFFGESVEMIGERFGLKEDAVYQSLSRSRKKLKSYLKKHGFSV